MGSVGQGMRLAVFFQVLCCLVSVGMNGGEVVRWDKDGILVDLPLTFITRPAECSNLGDEFGDGDVVAGSCERVMSGFEPEMGECGVNI